MVQMLQCIAKKLPINAPSPDSDRRLLSMTCVEGKWGGTPENCEIRRTIAQGYDWLDAPRRNNPMRRGCAFRPGTLERQSGAATGSARKTRKSEPAERVCGGVRLPTATD